MKAYDVIQDIPFRISLGDSEEKLTEGGCSEKNLKLAEYLQNEGYEVKFLITKFRWEEVISEYNWDLLSVISSVQTEEVINYINKEVPDRWKYYWESEVRFVISGGENNGIIDLGKLAALTDPSYHTSLRIYEAGEPRGIDVTWDNLLAEFGFPVGSELGVKPINNSVELEDFSQIKQYKRNNPIVKKENNPDINLIFYISLNLALGKIRRLGAAGQT